MTQPNAPLDRQPDAASRDLLHDRRALALIGAGVVAVVALGLFVVKPLLSSSSSSSSGLVASAHHHTATAVTATPSVTPKPTAVATAAPALDVRDPFSPLVASAAPTSSATAAPSASPSPSVSTQVNTVVVQEPGPTVTETAKYTLVLKSVSYSATTAQSSVSVTLNGTPYTVKVGGAFPDAKNGPFGLFSLSSKGIATFAYGDDAFTLHAGETQYEN